MVHAARTIALGDGLYLDVGYVSCFGEPVLSLTAARKRAPPARGIDVVGGRQVPRDRVGAFLEALAREPSAAEVDLGDGLRIPRERLDALREAIEAVRAAMAAGRTGR